MAKTPPPSLPPHQSHLVAKLKKAVIYAEELEEAWESIENPGSREVERVLAANLAMHEVRKQQMPHENFRLQLSNAWFYN